MVGPLVGFGMLGLAPHGFDMIFVVSLCIALVGLGVLIAFVDNVEAPLDVQRLRLRESLRLTVATLRDRDFRRLVAAAGLLGLVTVSDSFFYLVLQEQSGFSLNWFPLLFAGCALVYMLLAVPLGLRRRPGRTRAHFCPGLPGAALGLCIAANTYSAGDCNHPRAHSSRDLLCCHRWRTHGASRRILPSAAEATGMSLLTTVAAGARLLARCSSEPPGIGSSQSRGIVLRCRAWPGAF